MELGIMPGLLPSPPAPFNATNALCSEGRSLEEHDPVRERAFESVKAVQMETDRDACQQQDVGLTKVGAGNGRKPKARIEKSLVEGTAL